MKIAIAAFAKTPGVSAVKTRLSTSIGRERAEVFYRHSLQATQEMLLNEAGNSNYDLQPYWAIGESDQLKHPLWQTFPAIWTGEGELGKRLASVSRRLHEDHDAIFLIGTDCPQLSPGLINRAVEKLNHDNSDCVIGPAMDGGFYLFASSKPVPAEIWEGVRYSVSSTCSQLVDRLEATGYRISYLSEERDVDTITDLIFLKEALDQENHLLPAQQHLRDWLQETLL